jgi:hypothetical protein
VLYLDAHKMRSGAATLPPASAWLSCLQLAGRAVGLPSSVIAVTAPAAAAAILGLQAFIRGSPSPNVIASTENRCTVNLHYLQLARNRTFVAAAAAHGNRNAPCSAHCVCLVQQAG